MDTYGPRDNFTDLNDFRRWGLIVQQQWKVEDEWSSFHTTIELSGEREHFLDIVIFYENKNVTLKLTWINVWASTRTTGGSRIINKQPRRFGKLSCKRLQQYLSIFIGSLRGDKPWQSNKTVIWGFFPSTKCSTPCSTWDTSILTFINFLFSWVCFEHVLNQRYV